jgi:Spy/CpxP family protein refolding chaperone
MMGGDPGQAFEELKDQLGLSDDQVAKLKAIGEDARAKNQGHMKAMLDLVKILDGLVQAKAADADLQGALDKIKAEHKAAQADRDAAMDQREAVLTPQQAAKFVLALRDKMRQGMLRRMRKSGAEPGQGGGGPDQQ